MEELQLDSKSYWGSHRLSQNHYFHAYGFVTRTLIDQLFESHKGKHQTRVANGKLSQILVQHIIKPIRFGSFLHLNITNNNFVTRKRIDIIRISVHTIR